MKQRHSILIVEDNPATAEDLVEIVHSIDCDEVVVDNGEDALLKFQSRSFCLVLLDLQIKGEPDAPKSHVEHGKAFLREVRRKRGEHHGTAFRLPVLVVSGHAREADDAVEVMKDGASDVIQKPLNSQQVSARIRRALGESGRESHERCDERAPARPPNLKDGIVIAIPGDRIRRRTRVLIGSAAVHLTDGALKVLLHLMAAHKKGTWLSKVILGAEPNEGFKAISRLTEQLRPALADADIIENDYHGNYRLFEHVTLGECTVAKLHAIGDATISELASQLEKV